MKRTSFPSEENPEILRVYPFPLHIRRAVCGLKNGIMCRLKGESWWETDLLSVAKTFLDAIPLSGGGGGGRGDRQDAAVPKLPPLGVREWLVQEQVRSWLITILSRTDPMRLMEVELILELGKVSMCLQTFTRKV